SPTRLPSTTLFRALAPVQGLVADQYPHDAARLVGQFDGAGHFPFVALDVRADPHPEGDAQAEFLGQPGNVRLAAFHRIGADVVGLPADQLQVAADVLLAGVAVVARILAGSEWRER